MYQSIVQRYCYICIFFFDIRLLLNDDQLKEFMERSDVFQNKLNELYEIVFIKKPHPVDEDSLEEYLDELKVLTYISCHLFQFQIIMYRNNTTFLNLVEF